MLNFYWELGRDICKMTQKAKYGDGLLKNITLDLQAEFPGDTELSLSNIKVARRWYKTYSEWLTKSQQPVDFLEMKMMPLKLPCHIFMPMFCGVIKYLLPQKQNH